jgi:NitT/TauT family transport system ATP-binding protein
MIKISNVSLKYKNNTSALENISLKINQGEFISIIGPSGCGKTSLLKIISKLIKPSKGKILIKDKTSIVFQDPVLLPWRNVYSNINLPNEIQSSSNTISKELELVGLTNFKHNYPGELSGGMKSRVAIARALTSNTKIILMDEPFASLDELKRNKLNLDLLKLQKKLNLTIVFITHSISEAVFLSSRVIILTKSPGKIKEILPINLPQRNLPLKESKKFQEYVRCIREKLEN